VTTSPGRPNRPAGKAAVAESRGGSRLTAALPVGVIVILLLIGAGAVIVSVSNATHDKEPEKDPAEPKERAKKPTLEDVLRQAEKMPPQKKWKIEEWKPAGEDDGLVDRFVTLHNAGDAKAADLLAPLAQKEPADDPESERRDAGALLRMSKVRIQKVWRGEPDPQAGGKPRPSPKRYVLVTKGGGQLPSGYGVMNPFVVVEVKGKLIQPLRTAINTEP
jgi:hypothetical protein